MTREPRTPVATAVPAPRSAVSSRPATNTRVGSRKNSRWNAPNDATDPRHHRQERRQPFPREERVEIERRIQEIVRIEVPLRERQRARHDRHFVRVVDRRQSIPQTVKPQPQRHGEDQRQTTDQHRSSLCCPMLAVAIDRVGPWPSLRHPDVGGHDLAGHLGAVGRAIGRPRPARCRGGSPAAGAARRLEEAGHREQPDEDDDHGHAAQEEIGHRRERRARIDREVDRRQQARRGVGRDPPRGRRARSVPTRRRSGRSAARTRSRARPARRRRRRWPMPRRRCRSAGSAGSSAPMFVAAAVIVATG